MITGLVLVLTLSTFSKYSSANEIYILQSGDNFSLTVLQEGYDNTIEGISANSSLSGDQNDITLTQVGDYHLIQGALDGDSNTADLYQGGGSDSNFLRISVIGNDNDLVAWQGKHLTGTIDVDETGDHEAYWTITGNNNDLASSQTDTNRSNGGSGHHLANIIDGDYNNVEHRQLGKSGHEGFIEIEGDSNDVTLYQRGNGGAKWTDIVLTGDDHSVDITQRGENIGTAAVDLSNGGGAYDITLMQDTTSGVKAYSITGTCVNSAGCAIQITQN